MALLLLLSLASILLVMFYLQFRWRYRYILATANKLPCPPAWPFIGNLLFLLGDVPRTTKNLFRTFTEYKKHFCLWIGPLPLFVISDPSDVQIILNSSNTLEKDDTSYKFMKIFGGNGLITAPVSVWKKTRRLISPVFHPTNLENFLPVFNDVSRELVQGIDVEGEIIDPSGLFSNAALDAISTNTVITGDINIDWLAGSSVRDEMQDLLASSNLRQLVNSPTRVDHIAGRQSLLDWVMTDIVDENVSVHVLGTELSDHFAQLVSISMNLLKEPAAVPCVRRCLTSSNLATLNFILSHETWDAIDVAEPVDEQFNSFISVINYALDFACPKKQIRKGRRNKIKDGFSPYLLKNNILTDKQFSFVKGRSTGEALATFVFHVVKGLERRQRTLCVMMDLTKAFDCVSHDRLMEGLQRLGFANEILRWLESYLGDRKQFVKLNNHCSELFEIKFGVPQGFHCTNVVDGASIHDHNMRARVDLRQTQHSSALAGGLPQNSGASSGRKSFLEKNTTKEITLDIRGSETVVSALSFFSIILANHQDVQEKIYREILQKVEDPSNVTHSDLRSLTYLEQSIMECLRLYPSVPIVLRKATKNTKLSTFTLPANSRLMIPFYAMSRDEDQFPEPERFLPDRFSPDALGGRHPYSFLPFSGGPRNCIGKMYSMFFMKTVIVHLLTNYKLHSNEKSWKLMEVRREIERIAGRRRMFLLFNRLVIEIHSGRKRLTYSRQLYFVDLGRRDKEAATRDKRKMFELLDQRITSVL
ncbi:uncharacterized protein LOC124366787 [Homalodisca vitripennis]|uniref:uncharacterized protein LOC124366787 n=1 Tax=Homalodisca vitripennis TaxID=197043 RepID=UPI001EEA44BF|nr:uncharacterized protein LOC124366787 [Homalodisca vitripennis]